MATQPKVRFEIFEYRWLLEVASRIALDNRQRKENDSLMTIREFIACLVGYCMTQSGQAQTILPKITEENCRVIYLVYQEMWCLIYNKILPLEGVEI